MIVIPARYGSKRFPGKPLAPLAGKPLLERVWEIAARVCEKVEDCNAIVATEIPSESCPSNKILDFCRSRSIPATATSENCRSGSDRVWEVVRKQSPAPDVVVNLQGDAPTCPPDFVIRLIETLKTNKTADVASVYSTLSWSSLDALRSAKRVSPFSGTTVVVNRTGQALWFSKNIIPAIRNEVNLRAVSSMSPIKRHIGLYAYRFEALKFFALSEKTPCEELEQLEQLRFLENGRRIQMIEGVYPKGYDQSLSGIDTPEDLKRVEEIIARYGDIANLS